MERKQLNQYQLEAVLDNSNACLVNANVGSGKTTVLIEKIRYLHEERQVPYESMCVLTFTNKAAGEIQERLMEIKKQEKVEQLLAGTFHAVALKLLQEKLPIEELGYREGFQILTPEEEVEMAMQLMTECGLKIKYKNRMKKRLEQEGQADARRMRYEDDWNQLMDVLKAEKKKQNKMTYRELLFNATELLKRYPEKVDVRWVIVDEVQDCDQLQMAFLEQLKKPETQLFAVGDPNQVIYSWRGSVFQIFPLLRMKYQARELTLPINYRSTGTILEAAKRFLQNGAQLEGCREEGQKIVIRSHYDSFQEADYLAGKIKELHSQGVSYRDIAIFYRLQKQSEILEKTFQRCQIPCQVTVKKSMQEIPVLNWFYHVLKAVLYPEDTASLLQALCDKQYGEGWTVKKAVREMEKIEERQVSLLTRIRHLTENLKERMGTSTGAPDWTKELLTALKLEEQILPTSASYQEDMEQVEAMLSKLNTGIIQMEKGKTGELSLTDWMDAARESLNQLALSGMRIEETDTDQKDTVKLMTLHASKGLEFSYVFLIGVNTGLIPMLSGGMEGEEEERRLFFVGLTRAKEYLELSYYTSTDGPRILPGPSRFLRFFPERLIAQPEGMEIGTKSRKDAQAHLQDIRKQMREYQTEQRRMEQKQAEPKQTFSKEAEQSNEIRKEIPEQSSRRVRHAKYGTGVIVEENEMKITVEFADYGKKEFIRQFAMLEYLDE